MTYINTSHDGLHERGDIEIKKGQELDEIGAWLDLPRLVECDNSYRARIAIAKIDAQYTAVGAITPEEKAQWRAKQIKEALDVMIEVFT